MLPESARAPLTASPRHPAVLAAATVAALCLIVSVSFQIDDPDLWQHLTVGRAIWQLHSIPQLQIWCWPTYGEPQVLPSWGFRALLWPFWKLGGLWGLYAWRWLTTLAAFGLAWAAARRLGARGLAALPVVVLAGLLYRQRSQLRPETLVAVLLALEIWILERRRAAAHSQRTRRADPAWWLVAVAWGWVNVHISYPIGLAVLGFHAADEVRAFGMARSAKRGGAARTAPLLPWVLAAAVAASFANPFGWRALWQPFEYFLTWRHELIFRGIGELQPVQWRFNLLNGLPLLVAGWPLLALLRARRQGFDPVEALMLAFFLWIGLSTQRFLGFLAIAAVPYLARDLDALLASLRVPARLASAAGPWPRAALVAALCVAGSIPEWRRSEHPLGLSFDASDTPVGACGWIAAHELRGRAFNPFHFGGYLLWRFWPDPGRRPFMDIHQTGTPEDRVLAAAAFSSRPAYRRLVERHRFDWALLDRRTAAEYPLLDFFDQDTTWALVFVDDAAALFVRRAGPTASLAESFAYRGWPAGFGNLDGVAHRYAAEPEFRARADRDLARQIAESSRNAMAHNFRANLALLQRRDDEARRELEAALAVDPELPSAWERLGRIALRAGRAREALAAFERQRTLDPAVPRIELLITEARDSLRALEGTRPRR